MSMVAVTTRKIALKVALDKSIPETGTLEIKEGKIITHEEVKGDAGGITEVRGTSEIQADGKFHVKAEHLKNGEWTPGHEATYEEDAASAVVFK